MDPELILKIIYYMFFGLFGLCIGSFLNVVIYRWPNGMSIVSPPSHCPNCDYKLRWYDNIPVISYILLGGKCRNCKEHISFRYTLVELGNMFLWIACLYFSYSNIYIAVINSLVCSILVCIFFIDIEHKIILDRFNIAIIVLAAISIFFFPKGEWLYMLCDKLSGAIIGGGFFLLMFYGSIFILKKEGLGGGDVKYMFAAGMLLGWKNIILAILIASVLGSIIMIIIQKTRKDDKDHEYPFAPYLVAGTLISLFFGTQIINFYLGLLLK